jgi:hypothetical protein
MFIKDQLHFGKGKMNNLVTVKDKKPLTFVSSEKHFKTIEKTYKTNQDSDYTEIIVALGKDFNYAENKDCYWGPQELSTLYGTPLYAEASESQKLALNHLYWVGQYSHTANAEANTMFYNQVTAGVFAHIKGYETLGQELDLETEQEKDHIRTFQRIGYKTKIALLGKKALGNSLAKQSPNFGNANFFSGSSSLDNFLDFYQDSVFRSITNWFLKNQKQYYSQYLQAQESPSIPTTSGGLVALTGSSRWIKFLTLNWGSSPFLAAQYYSVRMIANMSLKAYEYKYYKQYREQKKQTQFVATPTAVSYFHLLDESFHTTMSQVIAQDVYKDFPKPTEYEKIIANLIIYNAQKGVLGGLSGGLPVTFRSDDAFLTSFYRLLKSPLFEMSTEEALFWLEKCICQEHEGFVANAQHHASLLSDFRRFFGHLDYLWLVNREMKIMAAGSSIKKAIANNIITFQRFSKQIKD